MEEKSSGYIETFMSKLKEQSFLIILMIGVIYFQNRQFTERIDEHRKTEDKQQQYINDMIKSDREMLLERTKYLVEQRDRYIEELLNKNK
jgi:23S rRNA maturation-related 3'-5' exoribonuclease YhaM